jgi:hypothetical protein
MQKLALALALELEIVLSVLDVETLASVVRDVDDRNNTRVDFARRVLMFYYKHHRHVEL